MSTISFLTAMPVTENVFDRIASGELRVWELWLLGALAFIIVEALTLGLYTIWFAAGCAAASFVSLTPAPFIVQVIVCLAVSIVLLSFLRPFAAKKFNTTREKTNVAAMEGREGLVLDTITKAPGKGTVTINGIEWSAKSEDGMEIPEGTTVSVLKVEGVTLVVKEA